MQLYSTETTSQFWYSRKLYCVYSRQMSAILGGTVFPRMAFRTISLGNIISWSQHLLLTSEIGYDTRNLVPIDVQEPINHYNDVIKSAMASQITGVSNVYLTVCSDADQRKHKSTASLAFVRGINRWPVNSPHKGPVTRKMFPLDDVIMC